MTTTEVQQNLSMMLSDEQRDLQAAVARFLTERAPLSRAAEMLEPRVASDDAVWRTLTADLGLAALTIPEESGGVGASALELAIVLEETGRVLLVSPFFATTALATPALLASSSQAAAGWLEGIAAGELTATFALPALSGEASQLQVSGSAQDARISGTARFVVNGADVDQLIVSTSDGAGVYVVASDAAGVEVTECASTDPTRPLAHIAFTDSPAAELGCGEDAARIIRHATNSARVMLAAESAGAARAALDMIVEYAKTREQGGKPIGSHQALKHMLADAKLEVEAAAAAARRAAVELSGAPIGQEQRCYLSAKSFAAEALFTAAAVNIQAHGAIGFTWEHNAHLYFKRATSGRRMLGGTAAIRDQLAADFLAQTQR